MNNKLRDFGTNLQRKLQTQNKPKLPPRRPAPIVPAINTRPVRRWQVPPGVVAVAAFAGGLSFLAGGAWMSIQMIMNPDAVMGLNQFLPEREGIAGESQGNPPQTIAAIQAEMRDAGQIPGTPKWLTSPKNPKMEPDLLLPVVVESAPPKHLMCMSPCQQLSELKIYQPVGDSKNSEKYLRLVSQTQLEGPAETFVLSGLDTGKNRASNRPQALTNIEPLQGEAPPTGIWLNLSGYRRQGDTTLAYGQVFHYNPDRAHLGLMTQWVSPAGRVPNWQEVTASGRPELVVDQSIGLEPKFEVYQIQPRNFVPNPIELTEISLKEPVLQDAVYRDALMLAKSGLWSPALQLLESLKQQKIQNNQAWPDSAQAQLDVVAFHAKITKTQADAAWSDPAQKALAAIIDGRWEEALKIFEADLDNTYNISLLLKSDKGVISKRLEASLRKNPSSEVLLAWGAVLRSAQEGKPKAMAWYQSQNKIASASFETAARVSQVLERLDVAMAESLLVNHPGKLMGLAVPVAKVNAQDWMMPTKKEALEKTEGQVWYQVRLAGFHDGQQWLRTPFLNLQLPNIETGRRLWKVLGLNLDPNLQISVWLPDGSQKTGLATVKAVSFRKGVLELLAAGEPLPEQTQFPRPVAFTADKFRWLEPALMNMNELNGSQPVLVRGILTSLWRELQGPGRGAGRAPSLDQMLQQSSSWQVQLVDLNGNQVPDAVLTLQYDMAASWAGSMASLPQNSGDSSRPKTLIFDDNGRLIYSAFTFNSGESLTGFADLEDGGPVALVVDTANGYTLKRWVSDRRRFE
ncbi:hypothetical protein NG798_09850 [Ancylothrix sp. C2]|uniref:hypothetical protein n=1 Tax=Ancylothrix sp. D3o TaxID=2953691 RepID=UPI0021BBB35A|nr:hypothetical protein [Ancylothrix sp. D3o]MCT7950088.1 hypothetical protein [Ancylothrix sp. D3o]